MKIITNRDVIVETCGKCNSVIGIERQDIVYIEGCHHGPEFSTGCCQCGNIIPIRFSQIPRHWYDTIGIE